MTLRFEQPLWLWLGLLAIPLALAAWHWFGAMSSSRKGSAVLFRAILLTLLAAALGGLSTVRRSEKLAVVAVVDVSDSIRRFAKDWNGDAATIDPIQRIQDYLARATRNRGPEELMGIVVFDGESIAVARPSRSNVLDRTLDFKVADGTNIAEAIRFARTLVPPDAAGRLLLISDGNETSGDALEAARETAGFARAGAISRGLPIDVVPLTYNIASEVIVESVDAPPTAPSEATISLRVVLNATTPSTGTLRLLREGRPIPLGSGADPNARRISLSAGRNVEIVEVPLDAARVHRFRAVYEPDVFDDARGIQHFSGDTLTDNNSAEAVTITPGKGSVLIIDAASGGDRSTLATTLRDGGIDLSVTTPENAPADLLAMQAYDLIVLNNVPAEALSPEFHQWLVAYVKQLGGGLVMVGGTDSFGAGGWRGTAIESILPVRLDLPERIVSPETATIFVMDNSGSMNWAALGSGRSKQEIACQSAALAISQLEKNDYVGLIVFNNTAEEVIPLALNADPEANARRALAVGAGGGTNMGPALDLAIERLRNLDVKQKHVVVLSDGRSRGRDLLAAKAGAMAEAGIKVSTIAVGLDADTEVMQRMADRGNGTFYNVINPNTLPKVFLKIVRLVASPLVREGAFEPVRTGAVSPLLTGIGKLPALNGLNLTQPRPEPIITTPLMSPEGEPVLAHWNVELGRVAAFASDAARWADPWIQTPVYRQFWLQVVRQMARPATGRSFDGASEIVGDRLRVRVNAIGADGKPVDFVQMPATVYQPGGVAREITLSQAGPGVYEGEIAVAQRGTHVVVVRPRVGETNLAPVLLGATSQSGPELRKLSSNDQLMTQIANATGGRVLEMGGTVQANLYDRKGVKPQEAVTAAWRTLLIWALAMLLLDIGTRRVAWDRWVSREFGAELRQAAIEAVRDRGRQASGALAGIKDSMRHDGSATEERSVALGEREAAELVTAARDRRRAARLAAAQESARRDAPAAKASEAAFSPSASQGSNAAEPSETESAGEGSSLLAAKRRAAKKFDEE